jgi:hypothetical protein
MATLLNTETRWDTIREFFEQVESEGGKATHQDMLGRCNFSSFEYDEMW